MSTTSVPATTPCGGEPYVASFRHDGLGSRIAAMIYARWLAQQLGLGFRFQWEPVSGDPPDRSIPPASDVFAADFLQDCHCQIPSVLVAEQWRDENLPRAAVAAALQDPTRRGFVVNVVGPQLRLDGVSPTPTELRDAWQRIGWSSRLRDLELRAREAMPERGVALHVRRGDIVYGATRRLNWPGKIGRAHV